MDDDETVKSLVSYLVNMIEWLYTGDGEFRGLCPHCTQPFQVLAAEMNCHIFRHGTFKSSGEPIPPHAGKPDCDRWLLQRLIYGCGKPIRFNTNTFEACDYI